MENQIIALPRYMLNCTVLQGSFSLLSFELLVLADLHKETTSHNPWKPATDAMPVKFDLNEPFVHSHDSHIRSATVPCVRSIRCIPSYVVEWSQSQASERRFLQEVRLATREAFSNIFICFESLLGTSRRFLFRGRAHSFTREAWAFMNSSLLSKIVHFVQYWLQNVS